MQSSSSPESKRCRAPEPDVWLLSQKDVGIRVQLFLNLPAPAHKGCRARTETKAEAPAACVPVHLALGSMASKEPGHLWHFLRTRDHAPRRTQCGSEFQIHSGGSLSGNFRSILEGAWLGFSGVAAVGVLKGRGTLAPQSGPSAPPGFSKASSGLLLPCCLLHSPPCGQGGEEAEPLEFRLSHCAPVGGS